MMSIRGGPYQTFCTSFVFYAKTLGFLALAGFPGMLFCLTLIVNNLIYGHNCVLFGERRNDVRENHSMKNATAKTAAKKAAAPAKKAAAAPAKKAAAPAKKAAAPAKKAAAPAKKAAAPAKKAAAPAKKAAAPAKKAAAPAKKAAAPAKKAAAKKS
jgi:hypothetical protein